MNSDVGASLSLLLTSIALAMYFSTVIDVEDMLPHESSFVVAVFEWALLFGDVRMFAVSATPREDTAGMLIGLSNSFPVSMVLLSTHQ